MRLTAREIIGDMIYNKKNLTGIELALRLDFGTLKATHYTEGPAEPALETLLNIIHRMPWMINMIDRIDTEQTRR
jgi:hypothetical protein